MRHCGLSLIALAVLLFPGIPVLAQTSTDVLSAELLKIKQQHDSATSEAVKGITSRLEEAAGSPDAALKLYQDAGGLMPVVRIPRVQNQNQNNQYQNQEETATEQEQRQEKEQQATADATARLAAVVQAHCQVMMYAVLIVTNPDQKGLHDNWISWLKTVGPVYPTLRGTGDLRGRKDPAAANATAGGDSTESSDAQADPNNPQDPGGNGRNGRRGFGQQQQGQFVETEPIGDWKTITVGESIIGKYLAFHAWEGKPQATWAVSEIPQFYRSDILNPLRETPNADTLAAWDIYIAMKNADQTDSSQWDQVDYPTLAFDRGSDDYMMKPSMEKLQTLLAIIKAVPTHPKLDDMITRLHTFNEDYKSHHSGGGASGDGPSAATTGDPSSATPNVTVQETADPNGMVVVTTHTNAAPVAPAPPATPPPAPLNPDQPAPSDQPDQPAQ
jgi:hypothetical protein